MAASSNVDIWKPLFVLAALGILIWGRFHGRVFLLCLLISLVLAEQVTSILKTFVDRRRPKQVQAVRMVDLQRTRPEFLTLFHKPQIRYSDQSDRNRSGPSFPSGHTANNTVIAVCCTVFFRRFGWLYWFVAASVAYSRIYLGAHWPSDVVGTVFLAGGETLLLLAALELLWQVLAPRLVRQLHRRHPTLLFRKREFSNPAASASARSSSGDLTNQ